MGDFCLKSAYFSTNFVNSSANSIASANSTKQIFIAYTIMYIMLQILIDK